MSKTSFTTSIHATTIYKCLEQLRTSPEDADDDQRIKTLNAMTERLNDMIAESTAETLSNADIRRIASTMDNLWQTVTRYFELRRGTLIPKDVSAGRVLRYKICRVLADLYDLVGEQKLRHLSLPSATLIKRSLARFVETEMDKQSDQIRSMSHVALKALCFWDRDGEYTPVYKSLLDQIQSGQLDISYQPILKRHLTEF